MVIRLKNLAIASCTYSLGFLFLGTVAKAEYVPPKEQEAPSDYTKSVAAGHRSGFAATPPSPLTLLAPQTHVGQTTSTHPTFAWYVSQPELVELELRLFEYDDAGRPSKLVETIVPARQDTKIQTISLSKRHPGLKVGQKYLWQVTVRQANERDLLLLPLLQARADIKIVETPNSLESVADLAISADTYARVGLWYDAFAKVTAPENTAVEAETANLLEELASIEATDPQEKGIVFSNRLQQIIDTEFGTKASSQ